MLFRNIVFSACFSAIIAGLVLATLQAFFTTPIIYAAEQYEQADNESANTSPAHTHIGTHNQALHHQQQWQPKQGTERLAYTFLADILIAFAHSLLLICFMALAYLKFAKPKISWRSGLIIGIGGYLSFYLATSIGLTPEIPGSISADLEARQNWWILTVVTSIIALSTLYLAPKRFKIIGLFILVIPHIIGAPQPEATGFENQNPLAIQALSQLEQQFLFSTAWVNLIYWLILGGLSGTFANKMVLRKNEQLIEN